ncbi:PREDICTED: uncharacterized protein LOC104825473 [Tarenaya hassleriana]|uniref:uncharacterized protein LOC104825473 n=1 Tax=Tarenaya hassleriana TaxID=28532 RepID=UPI00053C3CDC|nr:PREDICTED: uncharacterized protein LOC104825473 [Tarenaya hassleriana]
MAPTPLLGPPELRDPNPTLRPISSSGPSNPFVDLMVSNFNKSTRVNAVDPSPAMGHTEKGSATYLSAGNPCLDFFFHVVPTTDKGSLEQRLQNAWDYDAPTALKLICHLRGVRGTGKSDKEGFYTAAMWLHGRHPKTLACNLHSLAQFGYFKDFPEILYRLLEGSDVRKIQKSEWMQRKNGSGRRAGGRRAPFSVNRSGLPYRGRGRGRGRGNGGSFFDGIGKTGGRKKKPAATRELRVANAEKRNQAEKARASMERKQRKITMANKAVIRYSHDPDYRFLYERVTDLFADHLKRDLEHLIAGETNRVSLAAKWCPSINSSFDRSTLLCEGIARKMFPRESSPEYEGIEEAHYTYRIRDRFRKDVLVPLRKILELPEVFMAARDWKSLPYNRVASVAMKTYKEIFLNHDAERFKKYLEDASTGKTTVAAGALLPHEIIAALDDGDGGLVAELQWKRAVDDLKKKGSLTNCIAISDVSGSMEGTPMEVSIALGLLVSELSEDPWRGKLITFSENPELQSVQGSDLRAKTEFVRTMNWGSNTDLQRVFDLILRVAVDGDLKPEQMVKRVFVFSDMEFDDAIGGDPSRWETDHEAIKRKYREKGYGEAIPEMVFWNLRESRAIPAKGKERGVAMVSGFSKNLIKVFLDSDGEIDPMRIMEAAISGEEYKSLVVID